MHEQTIDAHGDPLGRAERERERHEDRGGRRDATHRLGPVHERMEHERNQRDGRGHHHGPRDPLEARSLVRAPRLPTPRHVADEPDHRSGTGDDCDGCDRDIGLPVNQHHGQHDPRRVEQCGRDATRRGPQETIRNGQREVYSDRRQQRDGDRTHLSGPVARAVERRRTRKERRGEQCDRPDERCQRHQRGERFTGPVPCHEDRRRTPAAHEHGAEDPPCARVVGQRERERDEHHGGDDEHHGRRRDRRPRLSFASVVADARELERFDGIEPGSHGDSDRI